MTNVILDANALLMPFQFSINLDQEIRRIIGSHTAYVPSSVVKELRGLGEKAAFQLSKKYKKIEVNSTGDDGVLEAAKSLDGVIVTNDKELKMRALDQKIPVGFLRSKSHLELEGEDFLLTSTKSEEMEDTITLKGEVVSGTGEAQYFLALEGYKKRFREKFGFEPYEGTLNIKLEDEELQKYNKIKEHDGKVIEGFVEKGKRFGSVECYLSKIDGIRSYLIDPERSRYEKQAEIISEKKLRDELDLEDGDEVKIKVEV